MPLLLLTIEKSSAGWFECGTWSLHAPLVSAARMRLLIFALTRFVEILGVCIAANTSSRRVHSCTSVDFWYSSQGIWYYFPASCTTITPSMPLRRQHTQRTSATYALTCQWCLAAVLHIALLIMLPVERVQLACKSVLASLYDLWDAVPGFTHLDAQTCFLHYAFVPPAGAVWQPAALLRRLSQPSL